MSTTQLLISGYSDEIVQAAVDVGAGTVSRVTSATVPSNLSFCLQLPVAGLLLGVREAGGPRGGELDGLRCRWSNDGVLEEATVVFAVPTCSSGPCHLAYSPEAGLIAVANYGGASMAVFRWAGTEAAPELAECISYAGHSLNPERQGEPHPHGVTFSNAGTLLYLCDLGTDKITWHRTGRWTGEPVAGTVGVPGDADGVVNATPGAGPRHITLSADGRFAYVINELSSTVAVFAVDSATGALSAVQEVSALGGAEPGSSTAGEVALHPGGRWVYASNRGPNTICVFERDRNAGTLSERGMFDCGGDWPRHFSVSPDGSLMMVGHRRGNTVAVFQLDAETGMATPIGGTVAAQAPSWVEVAAGQTSA
jgi:6-phosphogluconolactonase